MIRAQKVAGGKSLELKVATMPEGEDPADMLQEGAIDRFKVGPRFSMNLATVGA